MISTSHPLRRTAAILAAGLLLLAPTSHAYGVDNGAVRIEVIDERGRAFPTFHALERSRDRERRAYLQARPGHAYALRITNLRPVRVGLVIAVDGRNIISGKRSNLTRREKMYVLDPWATSTYRGWRTGRNRINEFYFTDELDSYAGAFGDFSAMGVLAVAVFDDRHQPYRPEQPPYTQRHDKSGRDAAPKSQRRGLAESAPGTGFGDERFSPSYRVPFDAKRRAVARTFIKYEWRDTLCRMGVTRCRYADNRFWPEDRRRGYSRRGYAPYPPGYRGASRFIERPAPRYRQGW